MTVDHLDPWCVVCMKKLTPDREVMALPDGCVAHTGCWATAPDWRKEQHREQEGCDAA